MSDMSNTPQASNQYTSQSKISKQLRPQIPDIQFLKTYQRRYDSSHHHPQERDFPDEEVEIAT